jgi:hypothetical protein
LPVVAVPTLLPQLNRRQMYSNAALTQVTTFPLTWISRGDIHVYNMDIATRYIHVYNQTRKDSVPCRKVVTVWVGGFVISLRYTNYFRKAACIPWPLSPFAN